MEVRAAIEIQCIDCHGTAEAQPTLHTTGPAAYTSSPDGKGRDLAAHAHAIRQTALRAQSATRSIQNSMVETD